MNSKVVEEAKERLTLLVIVYPVVVGLYAVGFFWDLPRDIISVFELTPFLFKASVVYLTTAAALLIPLLILATVYGAIAGDKELAPDGKSSIDDEVPWKKFSVRQKILTGIASSGILALGFLAIWLDPPPFSNDLERISTILAILCLVGVGTRPFIRPMSWRGSAIIFLAVFLLFVPITIGHNDAKADENSPHQIVGQQKCPVIFATSESTIVRCEDSVAVLRKGHGPLQWTIANVSG